MRTSSAQTYTNITGYIKQESEKAVKFTVDMPTSDIDGCTHWWPKSQIDITAGKGNDMDVLRVPDWLLDTKIRGD